MTITIRDLTAKEYVLDVETSDTILNVKVKIEDLGGPKIEDQRLIYAGKLLEDTRTLEYYNIVDGNTLHVTPARKHITPLKI